MRAVRRFAWAWMLLLACAAHANDVASRVLPTEYFTRHDEFGTVKISPDGRHIAFTTGKYGRSVLAFMELETRKYTGGVRCPERMEIHDFHWISPKRLIYSIAERVPGYIQPSSTGEIAAINADGSKHKLIYGYRAGEFSTGTHLRTRKASYATADMISPLKSDEGSILIAEQAWRLAGMYWRYDRDAKPLITKLDVFTGKKQTLGTAPLIRSRLLVDRADNVRFALGLNEQYRLAVSWKPEVSAPWTAFELPNFRPESVVPRRFSSDNRSVLLTGVREGERFAALFKLDLQTKELQKVIGFDDADVDGIVSDFADREAVGVWAYKDKPEYRWIDENDPAARLHAALQRAFSRETVHITSLTDDGRLAIVFAHSDINPGDYYLFDTTARKADILQRARKWVNPHDMQPKQPITVKARDDLLLHGYLTKPRGDGPYPLIVLPHGGPHGIRDSWDFDWEVQLLAHRGYAVLQVNFRGSGGYGMDFEAAGHRQWGARMQDDITDATRWAIEQNITTSDRICIFGASYGAYAAMMGAAREPQLYKCAVGYAGVYDLELMFTTGDIPDFNSGRAYLDEVLGKDVADLRQRSPAQLADRIVAPVLLIHGKEDWRADYAQAKRMKTALEQHGKSLEWLSLGREGHGVYDEETRREVYETLLTFLGKHLPVGGIATTANVGSTSSTQQ